MFCHERELWPFTENRGHVRLSEITLSYARIQ